MAGVRPKRTSLENPTEKKGNANSLMEQLKAPAPLGSIDTIPRLRSLLQTKMAVVPPKRMNLENPTEIRDCEQSLTE